MLDHLESQSRKMHLVDKGRSRLEEVAALRSYWDRLKVNPDFKEVILNHYLGDLKELQEQLVSQMQQEELPDDFEKNRRLWNSKRALVSFLEEIEPKAEKAEDYLRKYKSVADQGEIDEFA